MSERLVFELQAIDRATAPLKAVQQQVTRTAANINAATSSMRSFAQGSALANTATQKWAKGALQQAGFQIGDFAVQVANGTSSIQAFGQQAPQLLQIFGPAGAVIGAAVAVLAAFGTVAQKSGQQVEDLGSALGVLRAPIEAINTGLAQVGASLGGMFGPLVNEIDTAIIAVGLFAGVMAMRALPSIVAASGASRIFAASMATFRAAVLASAISAGSFSTAMTLLRATVMTVGAALTAVGTILMRFLPVAVLLGLAKLIEIFLRLKEGAGGFGEAMKLLGDLVKAVWQGMVDSGKAAGDALNGVWLKIKSGFMTVLATMQDSWGNFLYALSGGMSGLPGMEDAANALGSQGMRLMSEASATAAAAGRVASEADAAFTSASDKASNAFSGVKDAYNALTDAVAAGTEEVNIFGDAAVEASDKVKAANEKTKEELTQAEQNMKAIADSMRDAIGGALMSMVDGTKSVKDAFRDMARQVIAKLYEVLVVQQIVNGVMGLVGKAFPSLAPHINTAWNGGGVTGNKPVLVGEKGPELIVPSRNSQVIPNHQMGGGGVTVVQNINISTGVQQTVRSEIRSMMPQIAESAKAAVIDARRRGGQMKAAFG